MEIKDLEQFCIITPLSSRMDERETLRLINVIKENTGKNIGIDLNWVSDCTIDFFETVKSFHAALFNIPSDIFSLINLMNLDKCINLYTTEEDFVNSKRQLLNRKFSIVGFS